MLLLLLIYFFLIAGLCYIWSKEIGYKRGIIAGLLRFLWILPFFLSLFPEAMIVEKERFLQKNPLYILVDDSKSMLFHQKNIEDQLSLIKDHCKQTGCRPDIIKLSQMHPLTAEGYTPLSLVISNFIVKTTNFPWIIITDGGDFEPRSKWPEDIKRSGIYPIKFIDQGLKNKKGLILAHEDQEGQNLWIDRYDTQSIFFEGRPINLNTLIKRNFISTEKLRVQIQLEAAGKVLGTANGIFEPESYDAEVELAVPSLPRGAHFLTLKTLPIPEEKILWDNYQYLNIDVMANTVGVLHLLGGPSWDGRFLRRYLKSEPKYDLISFFILRSPWDNQQINERELSLIPFPVARLFTEELANFKVIILQDFSLLQFLLPEYQENLVKFIKEGGGLLFIGGQRALQSADLKHSPLKEILPFEYQGDDLSGPIGSRFQEEAQKNEPWYDGQKSFQLEMAPVSLEKRALADVYEHWQGLSKQLKSFDHFLGLHHMEQVKFKEEAYTPLLLAHASEQKIPLAVASYPGKGRAIWIFTDSLWRMALNPDSHLPRQIYHEFMESAMNWLLRQEWQKPLLVQKFSLKKTDPLEKKIFWEAEISGPSLKYIEQNIVSSNFLVCSENLKKESFLTEKITEESWILKGYLHQSLKEGSTCSFSIYTEHPAFGSLHASASAIYPEILEDKEVFGSLKKLSELSDVTQAPIIFTKEKNSSKDLLNWLEEKRTDEQIAFPKEYENIENFFWLLDSFWIWLMLLAIPLEVTVRRWHLLVNR